MAYAKTRHSCNSRIVLKEQDLLTNRKDKIQGVASGLNKYKTPL